MRFLLDVCADSRKMRATLISQGHDVLPILERNPKAPDEEILALAIEEERIIITEDKDFGELIFLRKLPHLCVIRLVGMPIADKVKAVLELIENNSDAIEKGFLITVTPNRIRTRP
jgi:predicted nuclease of predicted toxin-antitoxin system